MSDEYGRTGREWRFCPACQRTDALRIRGRDAKGQPILECAFCKPVANPAPIAAEGIFA